jgi:uncharacterized RDD family membrane protein YckC
MSSPAGSPEHDAPAGTALGEPVRYVGLVTRMISWGVDELLINLVALLTGVGVALVAAIFPITKDLKPVFVVIGGVVYVLWTASYFVGFWSTTGQTPGARFMQVRLVTPSGGRVKPARALLRWIGMNAAMLPLPWGFVPIPFGRKGFPDWLAHTRVIEAAQLSIAEARRQRLRQARDGSSPARPASDNELSADATADLPLGSGSEPTD